MLAGSGSAVSMLCLPDDSLFPVCMAPRQHGQQACSDGSWHVGEPGARLQVLPFPPCAHLPLRGANVCVERENMCSDGSSNSKASLLTSLHGVKTQHRNTAPGGCVDLDFCS